MRPQANFALSDYKGAKDGMAAYHNSILTVLRRIGNVTLVSDSEVYSKEILNQYDFVFRYGWSDSASSSYSDAVFTTNIACRDKNILIAPFSMSMLSRKAISDIDKNFHTIIYDSSFSLGDGQSVLPSMRSEYIHPLVGSDWLAGTADNINTHEAVYNFLHVSNGLYWIKGVDLIVDSFLNAFDKHDSVKLTLIMKNQHDKFSQVKSKFKVLARLHQLELIENNLTQYRLKKLYRKADCYVCASRYDTFSMPTLEAAVIGLDVIAHLNGGMRDYLGLIPDDKKWLLKTKSVSVPAGIWRDNSSTITHEPAQHSLKRALVSSYRAGKKLHQFNNHVYREFSDIDKYAAKMKRLLYEG